MARGAARRWPPPQSIPGVSCLAARRCQQLCRLAELERRHGQQPAGGQLPPSSCQLQVGKKVGLAGGRLGRQRGTLPCCGRCRPVARLRCRLRLLVCRGHGGPHAVCIVPSACQRAAGGGRLAVRGCSAGGAVRGLACARCQELGLRLAEHCVRARMQRQHANAQQLGHPLEAGAQERGGRGMRL